MKENDGEETACERVFQHKVRTVEDERKILPRPDILYRQKLPKISRRHFPPNRSKISSV